MDRRNFRRPSSSPKEKFSSSSSSTTWRRAVPGPKSKKHTSWRTKSKPAYLKKVHKDEIRTQIEHCPGERNFCDWLKNFIRKHNLNFISTVIWVIHRCADKDDLKLCEHIMRMIRADDACKRAVNTVEGSHEYTPLCRAAYRGSLRMLKLLVSKGADVTYTNNHGENLLTTLESGRKESLGHHPGNEIFINDRFDQCLKYVKDRQRYVELSKTREMEKEKNAATFVPFRPRRVVKAIVTIQTWWKKHTKK